MVDLVMAECDGVMTMRGRRVARVAPIIIILRAPHPSSKSSLNLYILRIITPRVLHSGDHLCSPLSGYFFNKHDETRERGRTGEGTQAESHKVRTSPLRPRSSIFSEVT